MGSGFESQGGHRLKARRSGQNERLWEMIPEAFSIEYDQNYDHSVRNRPYTTAERGVGSGNRSPIESAASRIVSGMTWAYVFIVRLIWE